MNYRAVTVETRCRRCVITPTPARSRRAPRRGAVRSYSAELAKPALTLQSDDALDAQLALASLLQHGGDPGTALVPLP